jgi:NADH:ubiquinone oxidoreductase subunit F (NADH-binding)
LKSLTPDEVVEEVKTWTTIGRGGAGLCWNEMEFIDKKIRES